MIPLNLDTRPRATPFPKGIVSLIVAMALLHAVAAILDLAFESGSLREWLAFHLEEPDPFRLVLSLLAHENAGHLVGNLLVLWIFGLALEDRLGWKAFLGLFLACGAGANAVYLALYWGARGAGFEPAGGLALGASGAIAGLLGLSVARFQRARVQVVGWLFKPYRAWIPVLWFVGAWLVVQVVSLSLSDPLGHAAQLCSFGLGLGCARFLRLHQSSEDELIELAAENRFEQADWKGAASEYTRLMDRHPEDGIWRLRRAFCLLQAWFRTSRSEGPRKEILRELEISLVQMVKAGHGDDAAILIQDFLPPFVETDFDPGLWKQLQLALAVRGAELNQRFMDPGDREATIVLAEQSLEAAVLKGDWKRGCEAAEVLRGLKDLRDWTPIQLLSGGEALRQGGGRFWADCFEQAARCAPPGETLRALQALERAWMGSVKHGKLVEVARKAGERLPALEQFPAYGDLLERLKRV
jgi:membrane associated rhomboid family serine protease